MNEEVQIAIVGAGPAGSTAAEVSASLGNEVVLIERKTEIGNPIQCGGFLPEVKELHALIPHARLPQSLVDIPNHCVLHRTEKQRIISPSGKSKEFKVAAKVIDRRAFDRFLAGQAARAGARILSATLARLAQGSLQLSGRFSGSIKPKVIIGADGPGSIVSRSMGNYRREMGICLEYEMVNVNIDPMAAEMYFSASFAPGGYAWIIPLGKDIANVGIGVRSAYLGGRKLRYLLDSFIKEHQLAKEMLSNGQILSIMRGLVPANGSPDLIQKDNMLLAGDAAGHVLATSGGGIPLAVVAGRISGEVASSYLQGEVELKDYKMLIHEEFGRELDRSVQIRKMVDQAMRSDRLMDALLLALTPQQMKSVMRAQIPSILTRFRP